MTTTNSDLYSPAPGWYRDPGTGQPGYWDGMRWANPAPSFQPLGPTHIGYGTPAALPNADGGGLSGGLSGSPLGFGEAISSAFRNMLTIRGRASRSAYWWFQLFYVLAYVGLLFGTTAMFYNIDPSGGLGSIVMLVALIPMIIAMFTLTARRLHDSGRSAHFLWLYLIPIVGPIVLFVFTLLPSEGPNRFGPGQPVHAQMPYPVA